MTGMMFPPSMVPEVAPPKEKIFNVPYHVRNARMDEVPLLVTMGYKLHRESSTFRHMDYDVKKVAELGARAVLDESELFLRVIANKSDDVAVGMFLACMSTSYFGKDRVANDMLIMVEKEHRGHCYYQLQEIAGEYKLWARERGAKVIWLATSTGIETDKTSMLFASLGFPPVGKLHGLIE